MTETIFFDVHTIGMLCALGVCALMILAIFLFCERESDTALKEIEEDADRYANEFIDRFMSDIMVESDKHDNNHKKSKEE